ncbi:hypothetical protein [Paenibacillus sp. 2TAB19]|uniref:hypothetical protein n=1 Tax=Paenibacillus sp. 2TAB19 TaxID=3233003 RepID=UPI003F9B12AF
MGFLIEGLFELILELLFNDRFEKRGSYRQRRYLLKLKRYARESEWFEHLYRNPHYTGIIENNDEFKIVLRKRAAFRSIELSLEERQRFEQRLASKCDSLTERV